MSARLAILLCLLCACACASAPKPMPKPTVDPGPIRTPDTLPYDFRGIL